VSIQAESTREAYGRTISHLGEKYPNIVVLEADISKSTRTCYFAGRFPERFINVGIAEQNEMMIAAGLASCGKIPFVSTYAVFASMRACEIIRTFVCFPRLNVKIAVSHGGITPGGDGVSHQATEDIGVMRTLPNMTVIMPADSCATEKLVEAAVKYEGPVYLRLTRNAVPKIYDEKEPFEIGKAKRLRSGNDVSLIALGDLVSVAIEAGDRLAGEGINAEVIDMHTVKPLDVESVLKSAEKTSAVVTVEDHNIINGLGSAVAEALVEYYPCPMQRIGLKDTFAESGPYADLLKKYHMDAGAIVNAAKNVIKRKQETKA
jgi:transketolase